MKSAASKSGVRASIGAALVALLAGCPKNTGAVPTWDGGGSPDGVLAAHDPAADEGSDVANTAGSVPPADPEPGDAVTPADPPVDPEGDADPAADPTATPAADPAPAAAALPKPVYTKIDASCGKDEGLGTKLKPFDLKSVDGKASTNKTYAGRVMLVNFWGTWCKPCLKELPEFDQLYRRYRKHGMTLVAIATDEDPGPVKEYIDKRKLAAKVLIGAEDYAGQYGSPKFPFTFVVDERGVIRASYRGYRPECMGKLEADLRKQLEARAAK
jgi:thiol-disulfide isomerase/thioredoxin